MTSIRQQDYYYVRQNSSSFTINFSELFSQHSYTHMVITSISIPKTFYVLPNDASLVVTENGIDTTITFEKGNYKARGSYSEQTFMTYFTAKMAACSYSYTITYNTNPEIGKYVFNVTDNGGIQPSFTVMDEYLAEMLGFVNGSTYTFTADTLTSINVINFQTFDKLLIKSDAVKNKAQLLQDIVSSGNPYNTSIVWSNPDLWANAKILKDNNTNSFNFSLQNINGDLIDLNGSYWSFVLKFFKVGDLFELIRHELEMRDLKNEVDNIDNYAYN